jgi:hypothetical protein
VPLPPVELKNKANKLRIFNVIGAKDGEWNRDPTNV